MAHGGCRGVGKQGFDHTTFIKSCRNGCCCRLHSESGERGQMSNVICSALRAIQGGWFHSCADEWQSSCRCGLALPLRALISHLK